MIVDCEDDCAADPIEVRFWQFHHDNPKVYVALRHMALGLLDRGHDHYGIKALCEVVRFEHVMATNDPAFKINNNFTALYARLLMKDEPRLRDFFEVRERISRRTMKMAEEHAAA